MTKILSIDPSGTGTSGICLINKAQQSVEFREFKNVNWKEHYFFISQLVKEYQPDIFLFENTNYIHKRTKDGLSLFRLLGTLECLEHNFNFIEQTIKVNVPMVKALNQQLLKGTKKIVGWEYQVGRGKGWMYQGQRVSIHCCEAYLVAYLGSTVLP